MSVPKMGNRFVSKGQKGHNPESVSHEHRLRKIGIEHFAFKDRVGQVITLPYHDPDSGFDDSGFFKSYFLKGSSQKVTMVKTDVCNHAQYRGHYVGTVQAAPQTGFKHERINLHICKPAQGHHRSYLKEGKVQMVKCLSPPMHEIPDIFL